MEYLAARDLELGVTHYKPPGAAWSQLVVIVVYVPLIPVFRR
jgi:hypothetical protein